MAPRANHKTFDDASQATFQEVLQERMRLAIQYTLITVLEDEVEVFCNAAPYQRTPERRDQRNGSYERDLGTTQGTIEDLPVPRTRHGFQSQLFERYQRRMAELDEAICNMFVKGVSTIGVGTVMEALTGIAPSPSTVSRVFHSLDTEFESWKTRKLEAHYLYVYTDGTYFTVIYEYDEIQAVFFSPDSKHLAYVAEENNKQFVIVDGINEPVYDGIGEGTPIFSSDSRQFVYTAQEGSKWFTVIEGKQGKLYDGFNFLMFSTDNSRVIYRAQVGDKQIIVDNGQEGKPYDLIGEPVFSPDGKHLTYIGFLQNGIGYLIVDGIEVHEYKDITAIIKFKVYFETPTRFHYLESKPTNSGFYSIDLIVEEIQDK